ncbi:hypothetical protein PCANC_26621 [Puccinia coronata f. sp. avenae]|uniref:Uncharacterized protein n=1 Tax=Puccinia coronata f. sp. avenae TaxID=200324 RepID=A0A2N5S273_9BASI|nr:hypothetical protein PCANC_26621 [Puccinia coronata f. sp. avenae]
MSDNIPKTKPKSNRNVTGVIHRLTPHAQAERLRLGLAPNWTALGSNPFNWSGGKSINKPGAQIPDPGQPSKTNLNWRHTNHPQPATDTAAQPAPTVLSNVALILAEMKAQRDKDRLRREHNDYRARRKADLDKQKRVTSIVTAVAKRFQPEDILRPDCTNLRQWERTRNHTRTAGINRSNTAVRAVLEQPCSTGGRTGTVRPKHLPAGRTGPSDQFLGPVAQDQPGPVGKICPTSWLLLWSDSVRPTTGQKRLFKHRSSSRV